MAAPCPASSTPTPTQVVGWQARAVRPSPGQLRLARLPPAVEDQTRNQHHCSHHKHRMDGYAIQAEAPRLC